VYQYSDYKLAAECLQQKIGAFEPEILVRLGSGLGYLGDEVENACAVSFGEVPGLVRSTAPGHAGRLVFGKLAGRRVMAMQGRLHAYEDYSQEQIAFPVRVAKLLGVTRMVVTNAAGGINEGYSVGDLMIISDFINPAQRTPLTGPNIAEFGERFCDMGGVFTKQYRSLAKQIAKANGIAWQEGVYCYWHGPQFETPAEIRSFRTLGADAVGMSTVPECIAARHCGMKILGVTLISNMAAGMLPQPLSEQEVMKATAEARPRFVKLILEFLRKAE
jgi:purine-nucleoside phosphorylase